MTVLSAKTREKEAQDGKGYTMWVYKFVRRYSAMNYLSLHNDEMPFLRQTCTPLNQGIAMP